jgi:hypothetical protein
MRRMFWIAISIFAAWFTTGASAQSPGCWVVYGAIVSQMDSLLVAVR